MPCKDWAGAVVIAFAETPDGETSGINGKIKNDCLTPHLTMNALAEKVFVYQNGVPANCAELGVSFLPGLSTTPPFSES